MQFKMSTIENSYDFLFCSLDFYRIADEFGTHDPDTSNLRNKKKWKMAFISLVQATELLIKDILTSIHPMLVFENIDIPIQQNEKTVSFNKAIGRLKNSNNDSISDEECNFLRTCAKIRNDYIHNEVLVSTPELKPKFCKLFQIYLELHSLTQHEKIDFQNEDQHQTISEIIKFTDNYEIFRGQEYRKEQLSQLKEEIVQNKKIGFFKTANGELISRIKYGSEIDYVEGVGINEISPRQPCTYCPDCSAKIGEYHLDCCDVEQCPICSLQAISCDCDKVYADEFGNEFDSPYKMQ